MQSSFEYLPQIFSGIEVRRLARPRKDTYFMICEPFLLILPYVWGHYLAERSTCAGPRIFLRSEAASAPVFDGALKYSFFHQRCRVPLYHGQ